MKIKMPLIGTGAGKDTFRPKYGGPGNHFRVDPFIGAGYCICTDNVVDRGTGKRIPFPKEILEMEDVEILEGEPESEVSEDEEPEEYLGEEPEQTTKKRGRKKRGSE